MKVNWILTNELRLQERTVCTDGGYHYTILNIETFLQQKHVTRMGATKWVDIPTVTK